MYRNTLLLLSLLGVSLTLIQFLLIPASASVEEVATKQQKSLMSERITVQAAGRGNPWIYLSDGRDVITAYVGAAGLDRARPLALAAADFDEDGVADLVSGYAGAGGGLLTLHRGNVDAIFPNSPEARRRSGEVPSATGDAPPPFLSPARVFETPEAPELVGTGDFDHDGHLDVVVTAPANNALYLLAGDGQGGLGLAQRIELPGSVTALATGEVNRGDGLADVVVAVTGAEGPRLLVFESPTGALRGEPEVVALPGEARALALGQFDEEFSADVAVAAGYNLVLVQGRERKEVPPTISQRALPFAVMLMTTGDFAGDERAELALHSDDGIIHLLSRPEAKGGKQKARGLEAWGVER